ncbi:Ribosomal large subunit pseudouridine synthase D [uncultured Roseburia sp.]|uniref:Pseudouridine synthase n=1 Tax=Brotonthovivens ammoniilytica TaxID=2981725 RepID=A0ABT2TGC0_9FIRM|nr:RluA family pseudouridine synthase [Brotonthovivens ammoniilytica]MCU6761238.1 RluA family pseudouridine synthase [Brotonthovivens ammoniilytica]SCI22891.1 Ribosomal large subunit pseudouridine synthase D [uncultured Roseburia sp.]
MTDQNNRQTFEVTEEFEDCRLDKFLSVLYEGQSRTFFQKLIKDGNVMINDQTVTKNSFKVSGDDIISVTVPEVQSLDILPENIPLDILYEDADILVVNKAKGMVVHPSAGHYTGTLVNAVMYHCQNSLSGINGVIRPGIVHRIDKDTTGSLIICKNDTAHTEIAKQIKEHTVIRKYRGIVLGNVKEDTGKIEGLIGRHPVHRKKMAVVETNGKSAVTHYKVIERFQKYTYMEFQLETGRTHQIRVHMASICHPLLGDTVYGPEKQPVKGLEGQTLHAMTIGFIHPSSREYIEIEAPLPAYFKELLAKLK